MDIKREDPPKEHARPWMGRRPNPLMVELLDAEPEEWISARFKTRVEAENMRSQVLGSLRRSKQRESDNAAYRNISATTTIVVDEDPTTGEECFKLFVQKHVTEPEAKEDVPADSDEG